MSSPPSSKALSLLESHSPSTSTSPASTSRQSKNPFLFTTKQTNELKLSLSLSNPPIKAQTASEQPQNLSQADQDHSTIVQKQPLSEKAQTISELQESPGQPQNQPRLKIIPFMNLLAATTNRIPDGKDADQNLKDQSISLSPNETCSVKPSISKEMPKGKKTLADTSTMHFSRLAIEIIRKKENQVLPEEWMLATDIWREEIDHFELNPLKIQELKKSQKNSQKNSRKNSRKNSLSPKSPSKTQAQKTREEIDHYELDPLKIQALINSQKNSRKGSLSPKSPSETQAQERDRGSYLFCTFKASSSWQNLQKDIKVIESLQFPLIFRENDHSLNVLILLKKQKDTGPIQRRVCKGEDEQIISLKDIDRITRQKIFQNQEHPNQMAHQLDQEVSEEEMKMFEKLMEDPLVKKDSQEEAKRFGNIMDESGNVNASKTSDPNEWTFGTKLFDEVKSLVKKSNKRKSTSESQSQSQSQNPGIKKVHISPTVEEAEQKNMERITLPTFATHHSIQTSPILFHNQSIQTSPVVNYQDAMIQTSPISGENTLDRLMRADTVPDSLNENRRENTLDRLMKADTVPDSINEDKRENTMDRLMRTDALQDEKNRNQYQNTNTNPNPNPNANPNPNPNQNQNQRDNIQEEMNETPNKRKSLLERVSPVKIIKKFANMFNQ